MFKNPKPLKVNERLSNDFGGHWIRPFISRLWHLLQDAAYPSWVLIISHTQTGSKHVITYRSTDVQYLKISVPVVPNFTMQWFCLKKNQIRVTNYFFICSPLNHFLWAYVPRLPRIPHVVLQYKLIVCISVFCGIFWIHKCTRKRNRYYELATGLFISTSDDISFIMKKDWTSQTVL